MFRSAHHFLFSKNKIKLTHKKTFIRFTLCGGGKSKKKHYVEGEDEQRNISQVPTHLGFSFPVPMWVFGDGPSVIHNS